MNPPVAQYAGPAGHLTFVPALNATSRYEHNFSGLTHSTNQRNAVDPVPFSGSLHLGGISSDPERLLKRQLKKTQQQ
jgi:hypothetical protein